MTDQWNGSSAVGEDWAPRGIDTRTPSTARMYDYYLDGKDNFEADRAMAAQVVERYPEVRTGVRANRRFLIEAVRRCAAAGIDQFIDLGTGIPTSPNVHEVAREAFPDARVVYVDHDPIVTAHNKALRAVDDQIGVIEADIRQPRAILDHPETRRLIDFHKPVGVLAVAVLHFVTDDEDPAGILAAFREAVPSGSHVVLTALSTEGVTEEEVAWGKQLYDGATAPIVARSRGEIEELLSGLELLGPGLVTGAQWCGDETLETRITGLAAIGRKP